MIGSRSIVSPVNGCRGNCTSRTDEDVIKFSLSGKRRPVGAFSVGRAERIFQRKGCEGAVKLAFQIHDCFALFITVLNVQVPCEQGCQMAKFDPFLSLDCARVEGVARGAQSKERKGSNFAA